MRGSDLFSLGAVLFEMATGQCAFTGASSATVIAEILRGEPNPVQVVNPTVPDELQRVIGKALEKDPADRYESANDLMIDLRRLRCQTTSPSQAAVKIHAFPLRLDWLRTRSVWMSAVVAAWCCTRRSPASGRT